MISESARKAISAVPWWLFFVFGLAYMSYDYWYVFKSSPEAQPGQLKTQIEQVDKEIEQLKVKSQQANEYFKSLDVTRERLRMSAQMLSEMKATLNEDLDIPGFIKVLVTEARKVGLTVSSLQPTQLVGKEHYMEQGFDLEFKGIYVQLLVFLERISNLQKIVRVEAFDLKPTQENRSRFVELTGKLNLEVFKYNGTKADEIASSGIKGGGK